MALSSLEVSGDGSVAFGMAKEEEEEEETTIISCREGAMDRGEDCAMALLKLIQTAVCPNHHHHHPLDEEKEKTREWDSFTSKGGRDEVTSLAKYIGDAMGGSLVARLVLGCLSLLTQEGVILERTNSHVEQKGNSVMLQLESLKTWRVLLRSIPVTELWKSILPGCFAVRVGIDFIYFLQICETAHFFNLPHRDCIVRRWQTFDTPRLRRLIKWHRNPCWSWHF
jgi:hypothetical protein